MAVNIYHPIKMSTTTDQSSTSPIKLEISPEKLTEATEKVQMLMSGELSYKDLLGLTPKHLESMYSVAYELYNSRKFEKAETLFSGLSLLNPKEHKYWIAYGASVQMQQKLEKAIEIYGIAAATEPINPDSYVFIGDCLIGLKNIAGAVASFELACEIMEKTEPDQTKNKALYEKAKKQLKILSSVKKE